VFTENCFTQFSPIHELGKFQWQALNFAALHVADAEERIDSGRRRRSIRVRSTWTWRSRGHLGFILAPGRTAGASLHQSRRRCYRSCGSLVFTTARTAAAPFLHRGADVQARFTCIGHGDKRQGRKTLDGVRKKKMMRWRKALMKKLGFFYPGQVCSIYKHVLMGLWSGKAQSVSGFL
jgi:hypothetical protein